MRDVKTKTLSVSKTVTGCSSGKKKFKCISGYKLMLGIHLQLYIVRRLTDKKWPYCAHCVKSMKLCMINLDTLEVNFRYRPQPKMLWVSCRSRSKRTR